MELKDFQEGAYDPDAAAMARWLADGGSSAFDAGNIEGAIALWQQALCLKLPLGIEVSILVELADALSEWFRSPAAGRTSRDFAIARLHLMESAITRLRELLKVPDPWTLAMEGWDIQGQTLDPSTYVREDERMKYREFADWCDNLCQMFRKTLT